MGGVKAAEMSTESVGNMYRPLPVHYMEPEQ